MTSAHPAPASGAPAAPAAASVDPTEIAKFTAMASTWWDPHGPMAPLHKLNPARIAYVRGRIAARFGPPTDPDRPFAGLRVLDVGCGGGLLTEPMARLGAQATGLDAAAEAIDAARLHAERAGLAIDYRAGTAEALAATGVQYDVVTALEIVEHVPDLASLIGACAALTRPGGVLLLSTLNRSLRALVLAKFAAEYVLRWLPRGTHDWRRFLKPSELATAVRAAGLVVEDVTGLTYSPVFDRFTLDPADRSINYLMAAARPARPGGIAVG